MSAALLVSRLIKYLIEGVAVAVVAYYIPARNVNMEEVFMIGVTAAVTLAVLDEFSPMASMGARQGAGWAIGSNLVNSLGGVGAGAGRSVGLVPANSVPLSGSVEAVVRA